MTNQALAARRLGLVVTTIGLLIAACSSPGATPPNCEAGQLECDAGFGDALCLPAWTDTSPCDCTPGVCAGCTGEKSQSDGCGGTRMTACSVADATPGTACAGDGNACTRDECDGNGNCENLADTSDTTCRKGELGANYHATGDDFLADSFLTQYHNASVRTLVKQQLQAMADAGANFVSTRVWLVTDVGGSSSETWRHHFPPTAQELDNLQLYAEDVAAIVGSAGARLQLDLTLLYLWCADYRNGTPSTTLGHCGLNAATLLARVQQSVRGVLASVGDIKRPDGTRVARLFYLDGEVMTAADDDDPAVTNERPNQRWFLAAIYPWFVAAVRAAGLTPTLYFIAPKDENLILDDSYVDAYLPALNKHQSMYWVFRTLKAMQNLGLPIPERIDVSSYYVPESATYRQMIARELDDLEATLPALLGRTSLRYAVAETHHPTDATARRSQNQAWARELHARPGFESLAFWSTPNGGGSGLDVGPPFDFDSFTIATSNCDNGACMCSPNSGVQSSEYCFFLNDGPDCSSQPAAYQYWPSGGGTGADCGSCGATCRRLPGDDGVDGAKYSACQSQTCVGYRGGCFCN